MTISFTFDDGLKLHATLAAPELEARGWHGAFNVPTAFLGGDIAESDAETALMPALREKFMTWDDARALIKHGHAVYPHSRHHRHVDTLAKGADVAAFIAEVDQSITDVTCELGAKPKFFCSPFHGDCRELREHLKHLGVRIMNTDRPNFGTDLPDEGEYASLIPVLEKRYREGRRHIDLMFHGMTKENGGWMPFADKAAFIRLLDEIKQLERDGKVKVVDYAQYHYSYANPFWRVSAAKEWLLNKSRRLFFKKLYR